MDSSSKRLKPKAEKGDSKRQSSYQQKDQVTTSAPRSKPSRQKSGQVSFKNDHGAEEETKKTNHRRDRARPTRPQNTIRSVTTGSNYINSTRGDAHSLSDKQQVNMAASSTD